MSPKSARGRRRASRKRHDGKPNDQKRKKEEQWMPYRNGIVKKREVAKQRESDYNEGRGKRGPKQTKEKSKAKVLKLLWRTKDVKVRFIHSTTNWTKSLGEKEARL